MYQRLSSRAGRLKTRRSSRHATNAESQWCSRERGLSDTSKKEGTRENRPPPEGREKNSYSRPLRFPVASNLYGIERILISDIRYRYTDIEALARRRNV